MLSPKESVSNHIYKLNQYISGVTGNTIITGKYERLAVERFILLKHKYTYKEEELTKVLKFFSLLNISIQNEIKQIQLLGFQVFWLANIYALYDGDLRLFDQCYIEIAKKNGKSSFFAALSLYEAIGDNELNASIINVASTREQARIMLDYTKAIIENSPLIEPYFTINRNIIYNEGKGTSNKIEIKASDAKKIQGTNCNAVFVDEYAFHKDSELMNKLKSGQIARTSPLMVIITTAANNLQSPAYAFRETCTNILEGTVINDSIFTMIFALDDKEEIEQLESNPTLFRKSNPALDYIFSTEAILNEFKSSKIFKDKYHVFLTDNLNLWTNNNVLNEVWIEDDRIIDVMHEVEIFGCKTYYGVDLSKNRDLNSICELKEEGGDFEVKLYNIFPNNERVRIRESGSVRI